MKREHIKSVLVEILLKMKEVEDHNEVLAYVFDYYLSTSSNNIELPRLRSHLERVFNFNSQSLFEVLLFEEDIRLEELDLPQGNYKNLYKLIRKLKMKYGQIIDDAIVREQDPFSIFGADINVRQNESTHRMKIIRGDGKSLNLNFKPDTLMPVMMILTQALDRSIRQGVFNLNQEVIRRYISTNENINTLLKELLKENTDD